MFSEVPGSFLRVSLIRTTNLAPRAGPSSADPHAMLPETVAGALGLSKRLKHVVSPQGCRSDGYFIDIHFPAIFSSVDSGTFPSLNTFKISSRSLHSLSLGTRNTARPLSHIRPRYRSERVGTRSHLAMLKKKPAHADRATASRRPSAVASHCSRVLFS